LLIAVTGEYNASAFLLVLGSLKNYRTRMRSRAPGLERSCI
jgi:hypothetical protein